MAMMSFSSLSFGQFKTDKISATLVHGNNTIVYYGKDALSKAYKDAAEKGDIAVLRNRLHVLQEGLFFFCSKKVAGIIQICGISGFRILPGEIADIVSG